MTTPSTIARRAAAVAVVALAAVAGCGGPEPCVVTGEVRVDGVPAEGVYVVFRGADGASDSGSARSSDDGSFRAVATGPGEAKVTAFWPAAIVEGEDVVEGADRLGGAYQDPSRPVATITIVEGDNTLEPILLTSPPAGRRRRGRR